MYVSASFPSVAIRLAHIILLSGGTKINVSRLLSKYSRRPELPSIAEFGSLALYLNYLTCTFLKFRRTPESFTST